MRQPAVERIATFFGVQIVIFRASEPGDGLALHDHPFDHLTIAISGNPEAFYEDGSVRVLCPGDVPLKFVAGEKHGVRATAAGDRFMNITPFPARS